VGIHWSPLVLPHTRPPPGAAQPPRAPTIRGFCSVCSVFVPVCTLHTGLPLTGAELRPRRHSKQTPLRSWLQRVSAPRPVREMRQLPAAALSGRLHCPSTSPALDSAPHICKKKKCTSSKFWGITSQNCYTERSSADAITPPLPPPAHFSTKRCISRLLHALLVFSTGAHPCTLRV
jgi:hypothetical protein